tara:strand:- start:788 stop:1036 length:249 start_codon:yes stop_codon:yes gene_type:complete
MERLGLRYMDKDNFGSYFEALVRKIERIENDVKWLKENMQEDQKHIRQIYKNKEEIQKVKTIGAVLFVVFAFISSFFGFRIK